MINYLFCKLLFIKKGGNKDFTRKVKVNENPIIPIKKGTSLGYVEIYQGKTLVGKVDLVKWVSPLLAEADKQYLACWVNPVLTPVAPW